MKVALHSILCSGQEAAYEQAHAVIPTEMVASLQAAGIRDWSIWRSGEHLFHLVDCDDFTTAMARLAEDPVNHRWQEQMAVYVDHFVEDEARPDSQPLREVWTLASQQAVDGDEPEGGA